MLLNCARDFHSRYGVDVATYIYYDHSEWLSYVRLSIRIEYHINLL